MWLTIIKGMWCIFNLCAWLTEKDQLKRIEYLVWVAIGAVTLLY